MRRLQLTFGVAVLLASCGAEPETPPASSPPSTPVAEKPVANAGAPWTTVGDVAELQARLSAAKKDGTPVVAFVSAAWCIYCQPYERLFREDDEVRRALGQVVLLRIDVTDDARMDLRRALGMRLEQPFVVFMDGRGELVRDLDLGGSLDRAKFLRRLRDPRISRG